MTWLLLFFGGAFLGTVFGLLLGGVLASSSLQARYEEGYRDGSHSAYKN